MRFGRNIARTLFEYYRFTNVLAIPILSELLPRKGRPKTHRPRGRSRIRPDIKPRPKTTRAYAPISYTDLSIRYDSSTSNEGSPNRYATYYGGGGGGVGVGMGSNAISGGFGTRSTGNIYMNQDQFSLIAIQSSKFSNLDFSNDYKFRISPTTKLKPIHMSGTAPGANGQSNKQSHYKTNVEILQIPPKPYLSVIDFNQLTRGGLELAKRKNYEISRRKK